MKEGSTLKDHLDALNSILMDLKDVEVKIDDEDAAFILLVLLPHSFENFVNSFIVGKETNTLEDVRSSLHSRELRHQLPIMIGVDIKHKKAKEKFNCPKLKERCQIVAVAKDDSGSECDVVLLVLDYKGRPLAWIVDFACSYHMSPNRDWFVTNEEFDGGYVFMGNDSPCKVVGIGTIRIKMHDGVVSENDVLRVLKGALVVMKATKGTSSLYTLQGETIVGSASVSYLKKSTLDMTMLWHMHLGHVSEKCMVILNKLGLLDNHKVASLEFYRCFWAEALNTACYLISRSLAPTIDCKTPIEVWYRKPADYSKLRAFRWPAYYHVIEGKLDPRGENGIFLEYDDGVKGYRIWPPLERRVILSRDVIFDEDYLFCVKQDMIESKLKEGVFKKVEDVSKQVEHVILGDMDHDVTSLDDHINFPHLEHEQDKSITHDRPRRNAKAPTRFGFEDYVAYALQVAEEVESLKPATYREAITSKESDMWIAAIGEKIESLHKNSTWELVKLPERRKVVGFTETLALSGSFIYLLLYIDDMLVAAKDVEEVNKLKILLNTKFDMKDFGSSSKDFGYGNNSRSKTCDLEHLEIINQAQSLRHLVTLPPCGLATSGPTCSYHS
ncbi:retrovirus-related pol polyprotein from transposon TNT 1-94 [Tanacetum coccineum]